MKKSAEHRRAYSPTTVPARGALLAPTWPKAKAVSALGGLRGLGAPAGPSERVRLTSHTYHTHQPASHTLSLFPLLNHRLPPLREPLTTPPAAFQPNLWQETRRTRRPAGQRRVQVSRSSTPATRRRFGASCAAAFGKSRLHRFRRFLVCIRHTHRPRRARATIVDPDVQSDLVSVADHSGGDDSRSPSYNVVCIKTRRR